jgi:hypothetical protein
MSKDLKIKWLLRLYPPDWRRRYEDEFTVLLQQHRLVWSEVLDVVFSAIAAHCWLQADSTRLPAILIKLRQTVLTIFCAGSVFGLAGIAFYAMMDDSPFVPAMRVQSALLWAWLSVEGGEALACLALLLAGLPIALLLIQQIWQDKRWDLLLLLLTPLLAIVSLVGCAVLLASLYKVLGPQYNTLFSISLDCTFLVAAGVSIWAIYRAVVRSGVEQQSFRVKFINFTFYPSVFALVPSLVATIAMGLTLIGTICWGIFASLTVPQLFSSNAGLEDTPTSFTWIGLVIVMLLAMVVAVRAAIQGFLVRYATR